MSNLFGSLTTPRLLLSPPRVADIPTIVELLNDHTVSRYTAHIPFPYTEDDAVYWVNLANRSRRDGSKQVFAIRDRETEQLLGGIGLHIDDKLKIAEIGYWIGKPYWGKGLVSEAAAAMIRFGFEELGLRKIEAHHIVANAGSGRVMEKNGMQREGLLRQHMLRDGEAYDVAVYGILAAEFANT